jgi:hypothetical protein
LLPYARRLAAVFTIRECRCQLFATAIVGNAPESRCHADSE